MAILRSVTDGKFYNVPDDQLDQHVVPPDEVKEQLGGSEDAPAGPPPPGPGGAAGVSIPGAGQVVIQIFTSPGGGGGPVGPPPAQEGAEEGQVTPQGYCFSNSWRRNCFRNCFRNCR